MAIGAPRLIDPDAADIVLEVSTALAGSTGTALIYAPDVQARSNLGTKRDRVKPAVLNSDWSSKLLRWGSPDIRAITTG